MTHRTLRLRSPLATTLLAASALSFACTAQTEPFEASEAEPVASAGSALSLKTTNVAAATASTSTDVAAKTAVASGTVGGTVGTTGTVATPLLSRDKLFGGQTPVVIGWAPDPTFPQKNLRVIDRTMTPRVRATSTQPAVPGAASFKIGWENTGSPSQVFVYRQSWTLGATNTKEFTQGPATLIATLGALPNGYQTFTDPAPALNTRNCYYVKAGDGTYFSYSNVDCGYAPDSDHPHAVGKVEIRLRLSTAGTAVTSSNVRVRLNYGIPGRAVSKYTWLDAQDTPFFTPGGEATFMLRSSEIRDLSDITMIRVEVPGDDGLCLNQLELIVDDTRAFLKTSPGTQQCGNGNPFEWAWHSGTIEGTAVEIPFEELRNSSTWKGFSPFIFPGTVNTDHPDGLSFVGYTKEAMRRKIDGLTAHNLKDDGTDTGSTVRRFRNGNSDVTSLTWRDERTLRVQQHLRLADGGGCTVDAHPVFDLGIHSLNANGDAFDGNGNIESTEVSSTLISSGIDQGGWCQFVPGVGAYIQIDAASEFRSEFSAIGATDAGKPPAGMRFCFPKSGLARPFTNFDDGGLSLCLGTL